MLKIKRWCIIFGSLAAAACSAQTGAVADGAVVDLVSGDRGVGADSSGQADAGDALLPCEESPGGTQTDQRYRFEDLARGIRVFMRREYVGPGIGESVEYALRYMSVQWAGSCYHTADPAKLSYENSHHNWLDVAEATVQGRTFRLITEFGAPIDGPTSWRISLSSAPELSDAPLIPTGGPLGLEDIARTRLAISEFMPDNQGAFKSQDGKTPPWIEIENPYAADQPLDDYFLTDDPANRTKWPLPKGMVLKAKSFLIVQADGNAAAGALHANFALSKSGGRLMLIAPTGVSQGEFSYGPLPPNTSMQLDRARSRYAVAAQSTPGS